MSLNKQELKLPIFRERGLLVSAQILRLLGEEADHFELGK